MAPPSATSPVHIVGAGPVGSILACLLGKQNREVVIWEKRTELPQCSMAIGITPPSLEILDYVGLGDHFRSMGVFIPRARVFENGEDVGALDFRRSEQQMLTLPQAGTLQILRGALQSYPSVAYHAGESFPLEMLKQNTSWIVGCDGARSRVRDTAGFRFHQKRYGVSFVMADFTDEEHLNQEASIFFSSEGAVESFPLPGKQRRWVVQLCAGQSPTLDHLTDRIRETAKIDLRNRTPHSLWPFEPRRGIVDRYHSGHIVLCGDAAHEMSPIGGQGMNTGFADAAHLARVLSEPSHTAFDTYTRVRKRAFTASANRAAWGMYLGTRTGKRWSRVRKAILQRLLTHPSTHDTLSRTFAMRNLPT